MHWAFVINKDFYSELEEKDKITWNSAKDVRKGDIILIYTGSPHSNIGFVLRAISENFDDPDIQKSWNRPAVMVEKLIEIPNPITLSELKENSILSHWGAVRAGFRGSHFKMSDEEWEEIMKVIIEKNPSLTEDIENLEQSEEIRESIDYYDLSAGRAHIVRDICYLISKNNNISEEDLFELLRNKVGDNDNYWKAYYQRSTKHTSPLYNLNAARTLGLVDKDSLKLTELGNKLVNRLTENELFTYNYSLGAKKFYFELALSNYPTKIALKILRNKKRLRFFSPICNRSNKAFWQKDKTEDGYYCKENVYPECKDCDRDFIDHIKESSLPFETLQETKGNEGSSGFWMFSRATPMYLTGTEPDYSGNYIYWDNEAEKELGDLIEMLNDENTTSKSSTPKIWKISPGTPEQSKEFWPLYVEKGYIGIGWTEFKRDFREFNSQKKLKAALEQTYATSKPRTTKMIWDFTNEIEIGDYIVASRGFKNILGIGVIKSDYIGPKDPENLNLEEYPHLRKVDWIITDEFSLSKEIFQRDTIEDLDKDKWNQIIFAYIKNKPTYGIELLEKLYAEFKTEYLNTESGQIHLNAYKEESSKLIDTYNDILDKKAKNIDVTDEILYGMVPHKGKSIVGFVVDVKAFFEKSLEIKPQTFPAKADAFFNTIHELNENDNNPKIQSEILDKFVNSDYNKGFGTGTLTPPLFFINPNYPLINNKTINTVSFLSKIIGENIKIDSKLEHYIDNKQKLDQFIIKLTNYIPEITDYSIFDIFCHWMCDKNLGFYAEGGLIPLLGTGVINEPLPLYLTPEEINTKLKIQPKLLEQLCGTLNSKKHVILNGAPGTGKTNLADDVCQVAELNNFNNGYILTTATSDWTTFDTIGGYMPNEQSQLVFEEGKFLQAIKENKWLIIDEINRSDIDKAFGQLFTVLSGQGVELPYKIDGKSIKIKPSKEYHSYFDPETATYFVGQNWRIIATMNVYDKDYLFEMSYAFMRRFTFIYVDLPHNELFEELIDHWGEDLDLEYIEKIKSMLPINEHREIGPAIFKDIAQYVKARIQLGNDDHLVEDAIISYVLPQFEGLENDKIKEIWKLLGKNSLNSPFIKTRLEEISGRPLNE